MFVAIDNTDMGLSDIEKWIKTARDDNGGIISPEFAMEILGKTNHLGHIKKVLANIKEKCDTLEKIAPYREFILSCVDGREMSADALKILQDMADMCGCRYELDELNNKKNKRYDVYDFEKVRFIRSKEELEKVSLKEDNLVISYNLPNICTDEAWLASCDFSKVKKIKFKERVGKVRFRWSESLPEEIDVSDCYFVDLGYCNLYKVRKIKFKKGAEVDLCSAKNLPKDLDVSMCSRVVFEMCDLSGVKELKFRDYTKINFYHAENLPKEIKFGEGGVVNLRSAKNLPEVLDFSMCYEVNLEKCDLSGVKEIKFRNYKQEAIFMQGAENFGGKVVYAVKEVKEVKEDILKEKNVKEDESKSMFSRIKKRLGFGEMVK